MRKIGEETIVIKFWKLEADGQMVTNLADLRKSKPKLHWVKMRINQISKGSGVLHRQSLILCSYTMKGFVVS